MVTQYSRARVSDLWPAKWVWLPGGLEVPPDLPFAFKKMPPQFSAGAVVVVVEEGAGEGKAAPPPKPASGLKK